MNGIGLERDLTYLLNLCLIFKFLTKTSKGKRNILFFRFNFEMAGNEQDASVHAIAGALGGLLSLGVFYPLDVLRSLVQLDDPRVRQHR